jgi:hypothetical protein
MVLRTPIFSLALCAPGILLAAQTPAGGLPPTSPTTSAATTSSAAPVAPSATLQPSLDVVKQAVAGMTVDRWKASPAIRNEAESNLQSVQRDVQSTLPSLLATADAAPDSPAKTLPVFRNIDALYDVMLRLDAAGRLAAPKDQMSALDQAVSSLSDARHALGDQLQTSAENRETQIVHLQAALKAVPPPPPPPAPVTCTPPPVKKKRAKPVTKPAPPTPSN